MSDDQLTLKTEPDPPAEYQALVGRVFRHIGPNSLGGTRAYKVVEILYRPTHQHGPWMAKTYAHGWSPAYDGARYRKPALFLDPEEYVEVEA